MIIKSSTTTESYQEICAVASPATANQYANTFSNYIYKHLDTAYRYDKSVGNIFDIYAITETEPTYDIKISVTTYSDKVRINVFFTDTRELLVSIVMQPKKFTAQDSKLNLEYLMDRIYTKLDKLGKIS